MARSKSNRKWSLWNFAYLAAALAAVGVAWLLGESATLKSLVGFQGGAAEKALKKSEKGWFASISSTLSSFLSGGQEADKDTAKDDGMGPAVMTGQADLLNKLLELLNKVEKISAEERLEERRAAAEEVEQELLELNESIDGSTTMGKQHVALIKLAMAAVKGDREGTSTDAEEWSDDRLLENYGLTTYATQVYWDEAYSGGRYGKSFDWYGRWEDPDVHNRTLGDIVRPLLPDVSKRLLVMGAGNSNLSVQIYRDGYQRIVNIDIAAAAMEQMEERHAALTGMTWHTMDAGAMTFPNRSFDVALEKGLFDALYAGTGARVQKVLSEARRVLKPNGTLISISYGSDRIERLFNQKQSEGNASEEALKHPDLDCAVQGQLTFPRGKNATNTTDENSSNATNQTQNFYVYACTVS